MKSIIVMKNISDLASRSSDNNLTNTRKITPYVSDVPQRYELKQNYPNPFNPATKISFTIPKTGLVNLKVYDILGREVAVLVNEVKEAGSYMVQFNGTSLSSGVYFYKIQAGEFNSVKRMVLIK